jgi:hypothetical protein
MFEGEDAVRRLGTLQCGAPRWGLLASDAEAPIGGRHVWLALLDQHGAAVGIVATSSASPGEPVTSGGSNPRLSANLLGWMLAVIEQ